MTTATRTAKRLERDKEKIVEGINQGLEDTRKLYILIASEMKDLGEIAKKGDIATIVGKFENYAEELAKIADKAKDDKLKRDVQSVIVKIREFVEAYKRDRRLFENQAQRVNTITAGILDILNKTVLRDLKQECSSWQELREGLQSLEMLHGLT